jgi:ribosomal protein L11 methyltransferase
LRDAGNAPVYEPAPDEIPTWQSTILVALFDDTQVMSDVMDFMAAKQTAGMLEDYRLEALPDQPWERVCLQDFKPLRFGKRLCICPSWEAPPEDGSVNVILDPGLAFGTGTSPTTALCLEWLDQHVQSNDTIIDYGCGSGILALAALKLGAKQVFAVDYDPQALLATRDNGERNHLHAPELEVFLPDDFSARQVDIVVANILAKSLIELAPYLASLAKPNGRILLSGILMEQAQTVLETYREWFTMPEPTAKEEWVRLEGVRK